MTTMPGTSTNWVQALRRYLCASIAANLVWEILQLPLFTIWKTGTIGQKAFAVVHCTGGDAMIAGFALVSALILFGRPAWPNRATAAVYAASLVLGIGYTIYSEWLNTSVRASWAYSELMPILPVLGTGVSPLLQWLVVPTLSMWVALGHAPWLRDPLKESS
ncbi:MAG: hypothetical protein ABL901_09005 [Hyphomicrobiaceae bacterium]